MVTDVTVGASNGTRIIRFNMRTYKIACHAKTEKLRESRSYVHLTLTSSCQLSQLCVSAKGFHALRLIRNVAGVTRQKKMRWVEHGVNGKLINLHSFRW
jgi:hypothetical protein